jgi:hypothetical protein
MKAAKEGGMPGKARNEDAKPAKVVAKKAAKKR